MNPLRLGVIAFGHELVLGRTKMRCNVRRDAELSMLRRHPLKTLGRRRPHRSWLVGWVDWLAGVLDVWFGLFAWLGSLGLVIAWVVDWLGGWCTGW